MVKKHSYETVRGYFESAGCQLVSTEYKSTTSPLQFICSCDKNVVEEITLNSFLKGCRCKKCKDERTKATMIHRFGVTHLTQDKTRKEAMVKGLKIHVSGKKHTIESLKPIFEEQGCKLLSDEYKDCQSKLSVLFACGCQGSISYNKFSAGRRCSNKACMNIKKKASVLNIIR